MPHSVPPAWVPAPTHWKGVSHCRANVSQPYSLCHLQSLDIQLVPAPFCVLNLSPQSDWWPPKSPNHSMQRLVFNLYLTHNFAPLDQLDHSLLMKLHSWGLPHTCSSLTTPPQLPWRLLSLPPPLNSLQCSASCLLQRWLHLSWIRHLICH